MTRALVTGGAGFIGSNIAIELVKRGYDVRVIDNLETGRLSNLNQVKKDIKFIRGSICNPRTLRKAVKGVDYVLHQAALPSVPRSIKDPVKTNYVNVNGTLNVLVAARDAGVKRVVYASSSSVYGDTPKLPKTENMKPNPKSPYAIGKLVGEYYCRVFHDVYGLETVSLRYFNVYGPRQNPKSQYAAVIPKFIKTMMKNKAPTVYDDGKQSRDFTYVDDIVRANILAIKTSKKASGEIFNIANGEKTTVNQLVMSLNRILGKKVKPNYTKPRSGDVKHSLASISKATKILKFRPQYTLEKGLRETIKHFKNGH